MSEYRQVRLDHEDIRDSLARPPVVDQPTATIGSITGNPGNSVPAWFRVQPIRLNAATPAEDVGAALSNVGDPIWGYILGPELPGLGDIVTLRLIGGRWVGEFGGGVDVCHFQCGAHRFPKDDMTLSWTSVAGDGTATLLNSDIFWSAPSFMTAGGFSYSAVVSCIGSQLWLTIYKFTESGSFVGQYSAGSPVIDDGPPLTIEWTVPTGLTIPEGTWTATANEDERCCGKFIVIGCVAEDTEVRAYDEDDVLMWTGNSVGGRLSKMWNGTIKRMEVDSPDYRLLPINKAFPNGIPCNSTTQLFFAPLDGYVCCQCDRPIPKRIYVTTEDGTFPTDINLVLSTPTDCVYTPICYIKTVPNGCELYTDFQPPLNYCKARELGTTQPTRIDIDVRVVKAGGVSSIRATVRTAVWASTGFDFLCRPMGPYYFVKDTSCGSTSYGCQTNVCKQGPPFGGYGTNPTGQGWLGTTTLIDCELSTSVSLTNNGQMDPPITSISFSP